VPLAKAGYEVTGVDIDEAMLARARARAAEAGSDIAARVLAIEGDLFTVAVPGQGTFRLAILALNSILLLGDLRRRRRAFKVLAGLLAAGGVAVVDAWLPLADDLARFDGRVGLEWVRRDPETGATVLKQASAWYDGSNGTVTLTTIFDGGVAGEAPRRWVREDVLHLVTGEELRSDAEDAGLEVEILAGGYDLSPLQAGDERAIVVARRPADP
jgi:SAM-dependent methyltransferase